MNSTDLLNEMLVDMIQEARLRKRRRRRRLDELRGDSVREPIRGPLMKNSRPSFRWTCWKRAVENHELATLKVVMIKHATNNTTRYQ